MLLKQFYPNKTNWVMWVNALFLLLLLSIDWASPLTILFGYFLETIVIGLFHIVKLIFVDVYGKKAISKNEKQLTGVSAILFFIVHYGMFVAIQSIFAFSFFSMEDSSFKSGFDIFYNYAYILSKPDIGIVLTSIIFTNLAYFYSNFLSTGVYKEYTVGQIFFKPYVRIFIQQFVVILAGFFIVFVDIGIAAAMLLVLFRLIIDIGMISIKKDSKYIDELANKIAKSPEQIPEIKKQLQAFTE